MRLTVRKAQIPRFVRDVCERFGDTVIAQTLASGHTPRANELHLIYQNDFAVENAREWLRESRDLSERRATVELLIELVIVAMIGAEIWLSIWGLREARRMGTAEFNQMHEVTQSLNSAKDALDSSVALATKQLGVMQGMVDPALEITLGDIFKPESSNLIAIRNTGPQSIRDLSVDLRCFVFRSNYDKNPILLFQGLPSGGPKRQWWYTPELRSGEAIQKNASDVLNNLLSNAETMIKQEPVPAATADDLNHPLPLGSRELLVVDFSYHRVVDNKRYEESRTGWLFRDSKTGKALLETNLPVAAEFQSFLSQKP